MLVWLIMPFYNFCGFWSIAINSVYKLQFFYIYCNSSDSISRSVCVFTLPGHGQQWARERDRWSYREFTWQYWLGTWQHQWVPDKHSSSWRGKGWLVVSAFNNIQVMQACRCIIQMNEYPMLTFQPRDITFESRMNKHGSPVLSYDQLQNCEMFDLKIWRHLLGVDV